MARDAPDSFASLVAGETHDLGISGALQFDARPRPMGPNEEPYPTPRPHGISDYPHRPITEDNLSHGAHRPIDLIRLTFQPYQIEQFKLDQHCPDYRLIRTPCAIAFNCWRRDVVRQEGCERLNWGACDAPDSNIIILFICWADVSAQVAGHNLMAELPEDFTDLLSRSPELFNLPSICCPNLRVLIPSFEIAFFYCPTASVDRKHFEHYFWSFQMYILSHPRPVFIADTARTLLTDAITENGRKAWLSYAGSNIGSGWCSQTINIDGQDADVFIGLNSWQSVAARKQWYDDFSKMSYDQIGWRVDGLKRLASLGVDSYCLPLSQNDEEWISRYERWGFPNGGAKPRKIVHVPLGFEVL